MKKKLYDLIKAHKPFVILFFVSFIFHSLYLLVTNLQLAPDEAHYWEWSRRLDFSYYSKGPLVAYIIAFFTSIFGDNGFGVRIGTVVLSQITILVTYVLTFKMFKHKVTAFLTSLTIQLIPLYAAGAVIMATDPIYITFWALALYVFYRIIETMDFRYWYLFAFFVGLGIIGKYSMLFIYVSIPLFYLISKGNRKIFKNKHFYLSFIITLLTISPLIIWSFKYDFINFMHVFHQGKNQTSKDIISIKYFFEFLGGQAGAVSPLIFGYMLYVSYKIFRLNKKHPFYENLLLLACYSLPVFIIHFVLSIKMRIHPNWPAVAYFPMIIYSAGYALNSINNLNGIKKVKFKKFLYWSVGLAAFILILGYNNDGLRWLITRLPEKVSLSNISLNNKINKILSSIHDPKKDPTNRLKGWTDLGKRMDEVLTKEEDVFVFSSQYQVASEVAFYTKNKIKTYSVNLGRRYNQYDLWGGFEVLLGKDAYEIEDSKIELHERVRKAFEHCEIQEYFEAKIRHKVIKDWTIIKCFKFLGFPPYHNESY